MMANAKRMVSRPVWKACGVALLLAGCASWFHSRDLVDLGRYRLESDKAENGRCLTTFDVRERDGGMVVTGKRNVSHRCGPTAPPVVEVFEPSGRLFAREQATLSTRPHQTTGHSHAEFQVEFDSLPPRGSLIRILFDGSSRKGDGN